MASTKRKTKQDEAQDAPKKARGVVVVEPQSKEDELNPVEPQEILGRDRPALTINIHSWATPIVGIAMLVVGALAGFYARPTVLGQLPESVAVDSPAAAIPTADPPSGTAQSAAQQSLMTAVLAKTRHFMGDPNALVTIIEFGDFQ